MIHIDIKKVGRFEQIGHRSLATAGVRATDGCAAKGSASSSSTSALMTLRE
jgi:hypothetical protein